MKFNTLNILFWIKKVYIFYLISVTYCDGKICKDKILMTVNKKYKEKTRFISSRKMTVKSKAHGNNVNLNVFKNMYQQNNYILKLFLHITPKIFFIIFILMTI